MRDHEDAKQELKSEKGWRHEPPKARAAEDPSAHRMDGYFVCDELAVLVHRMRELICHSQAHTDFAFLFSADDIFCELLETVERAWTTIEEIARGLKR